jgi:hypothetical protein
MDEVLPHLSLARRRKVEELQAELASSKKVPEDLQSVDSTKAVKISRVDQVFIFCSEKSVWRDEEIFIHYLHRMPDQDSRLGSSFIVGNLDNLMDYLKTKHSRTFYIKHFYLQSIAETC